MPHLLLRHVASHGSKDTIDGDFGPDGKSMRAEIRRRLALAEKGDYTRLLHEAHADELAAAERTRDRLRLDRDARLAHEPARLLEKAARAADCGQLRTAARLLRGDRLLPASETTACAIRDLYVLDEAGRERTRAAFSGPTPAGGRADVRPNHVRDHIRDARRHAHAGPSGERNSHVAALLTSPRGLAVLTQWADAWSNRRLSSACTGPWLQAIAIGGDKGNGKARPIAFEEVLLKLATSTCVRAQLPVVRQTAGAHQYGVYHRGGATHLAWQIRARMAAHPTRVYVACDVRNGFGAATRAGAADIARQHNPGMWHLFRNLWGEVASQPTVWLQTESGWTSSEITDGFLQGACEAPIAFAYALRAALLDFEASRQADPLVSHTPIQLWAYVDDLTLELPVDLAPCILEHLRAALEAHGLHLRPDKCTAFCPAADGDWGRIRTLTHDLSKYASYTPDGLRLLGTVAEGAYSLVAGAPIDAVAANPAAKRAEVACTLLKRIRELCIAPIPCRRLGPAWKLVAIVANNALSFDCCVLPPSILAPHARSIDKAIDDLLPLFCGTSHITDICRHRIRLPRTSGGCDLPTVIQRSPGSFLAQYLAVIPGVTRDLLKDHRLGLQDVRHALAGCGLLPAAQEAQRTLFSHGLRLDAYGLPCMDINIAPLDLDSLGDRALRHRQKSWKPILAQFAIDQITDLIVRNRLDDLGGDENALWLTANVGPDAEPLDDLEFVTNMRLRVDLAVMAACLCQHRRHPTPSCRDGKRCLAACDRAGWHAQECMVGGARITLHNSCCSILHSVCREAGLRAQREVLVPALATPKLKEPRIDIDAWGHPGLPHMRLDFTTASPAAARYQRVNRATAQAAAAAENGKTNKYGGAVGGVFVQGLALELTGRYGPNLDALLRRCAGLARTRAVALGGDAPRLLQHWRLRISLILARFAHAAIESAEDPTAAPPSFLAPAVQHHAWSVT